MNILIGISWPFANGDLHIGHAASSLPGDVIARYHRLKGNNVVLVSGSDCHGTPIDIKALQEKKKAQVESKEETLNTSTLYQLIHDREYERALELLEKEKDQNRLYNHTFK